jgi:phage gp46-like protein
MPVSLTWSLSTPTPPVEPSRSDDSRSTSGDIELWWSNATLSADVSVYLNDLARDAGLRTAVLLSLFLDRQAEPSDILPDGARDRRGWWADELAEEEGDKIGSRLWLLARSKEKQEVLSRAEEYAAEALRWLVTDKVASKVVVASSIPKPGWIGLSVEIYRPQQKEPTRFQFESAWRAEETR